MKLYKYTELSSEAQIKAIDDYQLGWLESHDDELCNNDIHYILKYDLDDYLYNKKGELINAEEI